MRQLHLLVWALFGLYSLTGCSLKDEKLNLRNKGKGKGAESGSLSLDNAEDCRWKMTDIPNDMNPGSIKNVQFMKHFTVDELNAVVPEAIGKAKNGVDAFKIIYYSPGIASANSNYMELSGLVLVPTDCKKEYPTISLQHYTLLKKDKAPSLSPEEGIVEASQGYVTVVADYIGYGQSASMMHPYLIQEGYTDSIIDMLRAARNFAKNNDVKIDKDLFLKGYSEGGYATMALQKELESNYRDEFPIRASAPSAGPYNVLLSGYSTLKSEYSNPFLVYLILSYVNYLPMNTKVEDILQKTGELNYASLFDGHLDTGEIAQQIPQKIDDLVVSGFKTNYILNTEALMAGAVNTNLSDFEKFLLANDVSQGWTVKSPTRLFHCVDDDIVPSLSSDLAFKTLSAGSNMVTYEKIPSPDGIKFTHLTCPAVISPILWFNQFMTDLYDDLQSKKGKDSSDNNQSVDDTGADNESKDSVAVEPASQPVATEAEPVKDNDYNGSNDEKETKAVSNQNVGQNKDDVSGKVSQNIDAAQKTVDTSNTAASVSQNSETVDAL
ncbi:MAG: hypothetical protein HQK54_07230 [Oligoflexales bacterium]|nr:hypothetical protein [Oligoflexales bacterium]